MADSARLPLSTTPEAKPQGSALRLDHKHLLAIRWMHWVNFPVLFLMIWSGLLIYWNDSDNAYLHPHAVYRVGLGNVTLVRFFPAWFWTFINAPYHVTMGLAYHFFFMWIFAANGVIYVWYLLYSGEWRFLVPQRRSLVEAIQVTLVDLHLRKGLPMQTKYNAAQRIAYTSVLFLGAGSLLTGLAIYKPTQLHLLTSLCGGYEMARWEHFWLTFSFVGFFVVHVAQVMLAGWNNFRSMVSGFEIKRAEELPRRTPGGKGTETPVNEKPRREEQEPEDKSLEQADPPPNRQPETAAPQSSYPEDSELLAALETAEDDKAAAHGEDRAPAPSLRQPEASTPQSISASPRMEDSIGQEQAAAIERIPQASESAGKERAGDPAEDDQAPAIAAKTAARPAAKTAARTAGEQEPQEPAASTAETDEDVLAASRKHTRRSFAVAAVGAAAGYGFYHWASKSGDMERQPTVLRTSLQANAALSRALFREHALAPTYRRKEAEVMRVNGVYGLKQELLLGSWRMQLVGVRDADKHPRFVPDVTAWEYQYKTMPSDEDRGHDTKVAPHADTAEKMAPASMVGGEKEKQEQSKRRKRGSEEAGESRSTLKPGTPGLLLTLADVTSFPHQDLVTQFKCIEGWSQISQWAGVRLADFLEAYPPALLNGHPPRYVYMETPNGDYYTGYDMLACRHPQALLVTEMMGSPLTQNHGAPLRLHMPTKYGYKQIKRIGLIAYTDVQPDDYWTRLGYDWYAGL